VLAHQGGWDEILLVLGPMAVIAWLLWLARRRVARQHTGRDDAGPGSAGHSGDVRPQ
jgi:hypothetical protein